MKKEKVDLAVQEHIFPKGGDVSTDGTVEFSTFGGIPRMQDNK